MQTKGERIRELRKALGLTGPAFAEKLGLTKGALSNIERNVNGASDRTIRLICSVYGADYFWLTEGKGSMFVDSVDALLDEIIAEKKLDSETAKMLKRFFKLSDESQKIVLKAIDSLLNERKQ